MMKENEDGVVHLVVGEDSFALCTRSSLRRGEGQKKWKKNGASRTVEVEVGGGCTNFLEGKIKEKRKENNKYSPWPCRMARSNSVAPSSYPK